MSAIPQPPSCS